MWIALGRCTAFQGSESAGRVPPHPAASRRADQRADRHPDQPTERRTCADQHPHAHAPTTAPTATPLPTTTVRRPDIIKMYPDAPSKVVHTHHTGVWDGEDLVPEAIRQMLDVSTIRSPGNLHTRIGRAIAELSTLPPIKDRTRLIIGDVLTACLRYKNAWPYWSPDWTGDSILMGFDPVAHDTVGLQLFSQLLIDDGDNSAGATNMATPCLENGAELGLGTNDLDNIDLVEVNLG